MSDKLEAPSTVRRIVGPTILLVSGEYFDYENPEGLRFDVGDIARGLSHICRFAGQSPRFYSVAEHSVHVSRIVPPEQALAGLLHDAAEAFVGDMAKPLKVMCPDYQAVEKRVEKAVLAEFGIAMPLDPSIKEADIRMLATEQAQLMNNRDDWGHTHGRDAVEGLQIQCLSPDEAHDLFIARFEQLTGRSSGIGRRASTPPAAADAVNDLANLLLETWKRVDPNSGVAKHPASYVANFADMARAALTLPITVPTTAMIDAGRKAITDRYYAGGKVHQMTAVKPRELAEIVLRAALGEATP